jgi:hypothetical protein
MVTLAVPAGVRNKPPLPVISVVSVERENITFPSNGLPLTVPAAVKDSVKVIGPAAAVSGIKPHASRTSTGSPERTLFVMASLLSRRGSGVGESQDVANTGPYQLEQIF